MYATIGGCNAEPELASGMGAGTLERLIARCSRQFDVVEVDVDVAIVAAESDVQRVIDRLRDGELTGRELAALARAVTAQLEALAEPLDAAVAAVEHARAEIERWLANIALAERHDDPDLAGQIRERVANDRACFAITEATLYEYRAAETQLREIGRLVLERAQR